MGSILFNAFSFLKKQLEEKNIPCTNVQVSFSKGQSVRDILKDMQIAETDIEGVFVNGKIAPITTLLNDGDRIAAFPPGTPGPYRLLLGIVNRSTDSKGSGNAD